MDKINYSQKENINLYREYDDKDFNFIEWCKQFMNITSNFIDIENNNNGVYSCILSKICNNVYTFDNTDTDIESIREDSKAGEPQLNGTHNESIL